MTTGFGTPLPRGQRIGVFEVETMLGAGGMGEVYRARDTRLGRSVAIKLLPPAFAADPDRLSRFEREARVLASLNHPNIGAVYGLEPGDGVTALVMELVDGDDLSKRIAAGPLRMADALAIARQIATALEAAHDQGVVHRDLKPANIKVRPDGTVKVLDFGLAKSMESAAANGVTVTMVTEPGLVLGTPAYMSPEQARGESVDRQADIWAFGVVLYEMLTGAAPFAGRTTAETLARVLEREPEESRLPRDTPPAVRRLLRRCLDKDRRRRLQHIGDARIEIEDALAPNAGPFDAEPSPIARRTRTWQILSALTVIALLAAIGGWWLAARDRAPAGGPVVRLTLPAMGAAFSQPFGVRHLAISKDGSRVAYASATGVLVRRIDQGEPVVLDERGMNPFFSPDDHWIGFAGAAGLMKARVSGGAPIMIVPTTDRPAGGTWGTDGTIVFATSEGLYRVSQDGGAATLLAKPDAAHQERALAWPQFMPDGHSVLFTILKRSIDEAQIASLDLRTGDRSIVLKGGTAAQYTSRGELVYASGRNLNVVAFDLASDQIRGEPVAAANIVIANPPDNGAADFALADNGTLIFTGTSSTSPPRAVVWVDRAGREEPLSLPPNPYFYPRISPDGTLVALDIPGVNRDISVYNLARKLLTPLTDGPNEDKLPVWSVDSQRLFFASNRENNDDVYSQAANGATPARLEFSAPGSQFPQSFTPDGSRLIVYEDFKDLGVLELAHPDRGLEPLLHSRFDERAAVVSPDGHWFAHESNESGRFEIWIRSFPDVTGRREQVSNGGGRFPHWSATGSGELFYVDPNGMMMSAAVTLQPTLTVGTVTPLFRTEKPPDGPSGTPYDVASDGRFLIARPVPVTSDPAAINVVLNWFTELRQRAPDAAR